MEIDARDGLGLVPISGERLWRSEGRQDIVIIRAGRGHKPTNEMKDQREKRAEGTLPIDALKTF